MAFLIPVLSDLLYAMKLIKTYDCSGRCLGEEFVDLSKLQQSTKEAILQMIYLDETLDIYTKNKAVCDCAGCRAIDELDI